MAQLGDPIMAHLLGGPATTAELTVALEISQPALSRAMQPLMKAGHVLRLGAARSTRYARHRAIPGASAPWPVFRVDRRGVIEEFGTLHALEPRLYFFACRERALRGLTASIPYCLQDHGRRASSVARCRPRGPNWHCPGE
jgi:DNA-binding transcriptional ArsR family regulator